MVKLELKPGEVELHGKIYKMVALRINEFREKHPLFGIDTDLICNAELVVVKATIHDEEGRQLGSGYAEELRGSTNINKTSVVENCETSAIGRALASFGFGGTEYASADEMTNALRQQKNNQLIDYNFHVAKHIQTIAVVKSGILEGNLSTAAEAWYELSQDEQKALWKAYSKGGIFTTEEQKVIKSSEFRIAHFGENNSED